MTTKPIVVSHHVAKRLKQRQIDRRDVRWLLHTAERTKNLSTERGQRWQVDGEVKGRHLRVIFAEYPHRIVVISAHIRGEE
jgi:hypothetical protein